MANSLSTVPFDLDATEDFILYRCGPELTGVIGEVFGRLREAEARLEQVREAARGYLEWIDQSPLYLEGWTPSHGPELDRLRAISENAATSKAGNEPL